LKQEICFFFFPSIKFDLIKIKLTEYIDKVLRHTGKFFLESEQFTVHKDNSLYKTIVHAIIHDNPKEIFQIIHVSVFRLFLQKLHSIELMCYLCLRRWLKLTLNIFSGLVVWAYVICRSYWFWSNDCCLTSLSEL
jgi:hypothetical protein